MWCRERYHVSFSQVAKRLVLILLTHAPHTLFEWVIAQFVKLQYAVLCLNTVSFQDLYSLRAPVGNVEGFDISAFDRQVRQERWMPHNGLICVPLNWFVQVGKVNSDDEWVEPEMHPLWEYPAHPRSKVYTLMNFDLIALVPSTPIRVGGVMELTHPPLPSSSRGGEGRCNGVVLWMDYQLTDQITTTTGLMTVCTQIEHVCIVWMCCLCIILGQRMVWGCFFCSPL